MLFWLVAANATIGAIIMTVVSVQLLSILQAQGLSLATAIGLATVIGPCQIAVRLLDAIGPKKHPIWSAFLSALLTLGGVGVLVSYPTWAIVGVCLYAFGNGLRSILRGTLPLALFSPTKYPIVLGQLAFPALLAQAITPIVGDYVLQMYGASAVVYTLLGLSFANLLVTWAIGRCVGVRLFSLTAVQRLVDVQSAS